MLAAANLLPRPIVDFRPSSDRIQRTRSAVGFFCHQWAERLSVGVIQTLAAGPADHGRRPGCRNQGRWAMSVDRAVEHLNRQQRTSLTQGTRQFR